MECQKPNIAEKLAPFVEGALAEVDRREVQEHCLMLGLDSRNSLLAPDGRPVARDRRQEA